MAVSPSSSVGSSTAVLSIVDDSKSVCRSSIPTVQQYLGVLFPPGATIALFVRKFPSQSLCITGEGAIFLRIPLTAEKNLGISFCCTLFVLRLLLLPYIAPCSACRVSDTSIRLLATFFLTCTLWHSSSNHPFLRSSLNSAHHLPGWHTHRSVGRLPKLKVFRLSLSLISLIQLQLVQLLVICSQLPYRLLKNQTHSSKHSSLLFLGERGWCYGMTFYSHFSLKVICDPSDHKGLGNLH